MESAYYRLELLPSEDGKAFYSRDITRDNQNAGYDLFVVKEEQCEAGKVSLLDLGCKARMIKCSPDGSETEVHYWLAPRSSIWKSGVTQANSLGIIDKSYRGPLMGAVLPIHKPSGYWAQFSSGDGPKTGSYIWKNCDSRETGSPVIEVGQRLFQILAPDMGWIKEIKIVESLNTTQRGDGGFGSTGK
jgi:dUTP pyrophosphatase